MELKRHETLSIGSTPTKRSPFFDPSTLPWSPWVMEGTEYKLLNLNPQTGGFTILLRVGPQNVAPLHGHIGSLEGWILEGSFEYGTDQGKAGDYIYEAGGIRHEPTSRQGVTIFAIAFGPVCGYEADGRIAGILDARAMYDLAVSHGAAGHLEKPSHW